MIQHITTLLAHDMEIVEEIRTLGFAGGDGEEWDKEMDFGDDGVDNEQQGSSQQSPPSTSSSSVSEYVPSPKRRKHDGPADMTEEDWNAYKQRAFVYWTTDPTTGEPRTKRLSHASVRNQFKKIKHMNILYNLEKKMNTPSIHKINRAVLQKFKEKETEGAIIHDRTLRLWAMQHKRAMDPHNTIQFKASDSWVYRFKQRNNIVDRAITHTVGRNWQNKDANLSQACDAFVAKIRNRIVTDNLPPTHVFNADQSRFDKELHGHRTLRTRGTTVVRTVVGSVAATQHSLMIMPVISMAGEILRPTYVLVSEPSGKFPQSKPADPPNIRSYAGTTANMSKADLQRFYRDVLWPSMPGDRTNILLLVDSWCSNKDHALSAAEVPDGKVLHKELVPEGCTGKIQPLDIHFFRHYKSFVRYITDTIIMETQANIWHRDSFLALQAFALYQFSAPRFKNLIKYAFYKGGYLDDAPGMWIAPREYCFDSLTTDACTKCEAIAFVKCAHCELSFCPSHCLFAELHIDCLL